MYVRVRYQSSSHIWHSIRRHTATQADGRWQGQELKALAPRHEKMNRPQAFSTCPYGATALTHCCDVVLNLCAKTTIETEKKSMHVPADSSWWPLWLQPSLQVVGVWITFLCWIKGAAAPGTQKPFYFREVNQWENWLISPGHSCISEIMQLSVLNGSHGAVKHPQLF